MFRNVWRFGLEFGLFRTCPQSDYRGKFVWTVRNVDCPRGGVHIIEVEFVWNLVSFGPSGLYVIERCPYYRGRVCMEFGLFRTKLTVRNREVSVWNVDLELSILYGICMEFGLSDQVDCP